MALPTIDPGEIRTDNVDQVAAADHNTQRTALNDLYDMLTGAKKLDIAQEFLWIDEPFAPGSGSTGTTATLGAYGWTVAAAGTGADVEAVGGIGIGNGRDLTTGTTTTGSCTIHLGLTLSTGVPTFDIRWKATIATLSTAGEEFIVRLGFHDATTGDVTDGMYFEYNRLSSVNWRICTADGGVRTQTNSSTAVDTSGHWFRIACSDATTVHYYIDGTEIGSGIATNLPDAGADFFGPAAQIIKSAGSTQRTVSVARFIGKIHQ